MGPAVCYGLGTISMKEDWVQGAPLHSHTQISYAGTRDNSRRRAYMPATIVVARGLLSPMQWCGRRFSAEGQRVKEDPDLLIILKRCDRQKFFVFSTVYSHKYVCTYLYRAARMNLVMRKCQ